MNHFSDERTQNFNDQTRPPTAPIAPLDVEAKRKQIEANIRRLTEKPDDQPIAPTSNFDVFDYASLSRVPQTEELGEADPFVSPVVSEVVNSEPTNDSFSDPSQMSFPAAKSVDEILQRLNEYQSELGSGELNATTLKDLSSEDMTKDQPGTLYSTRPEVEVIPESKAVDSQIFDNDSLLGTIADLEQTNDWKQADSPPVSWFSDSLAQEPSTNNQEGCSQETAPNMMVPLVNPLNNGDPEFGEAVFDVRDFSDSSSGVIEQIPGAQELEPDFFEYHMVDELDSDANPPAPEQFCEPSTSFETNPSAEIEAADPATDYHPAGQREPDPNSEDQLFIANNGDVIQIDGNDGFGYIDLACFDVQQATFQEQAINIDDGAGSVFKIHHRNIPYALFADGVEVDLTPDEPRGKIGEN